MTQGEAGTLPCDGRDAHTEMVYRLRHKKGFRSVFKPVLAGRPDLMLNSRGIYEWMMHPDDAFHAVAFGITVEGKTLPCVCVDVLPFMGALMIRATDPDRPVGFVDASQAKPS